MGMEYIFWFSVAMIFYAYLGYPVVLYILSMIRKKQVLRNEGYRPDVSFIITVHNEQDRLPEKIKNTLALDYPKEKLEIIFASDASTDQTDAIVQSYPQFRLVRSPERRGKEFAQKCAVDQAHGEILVFSDVSTLLESHGIQKIVANFVDPTVGCVSSEDRFVDRQGQVSGEGVYVKYEMFLRRLESQVCSVVGLSGSFFAARREVCTNWDVDLQSDFNTLINSQKISLRGISDPYSLGYYGNIKDERKEFHRKVRTVVRGLTVMKRNLQVLNPIIYGFFSFEILSHKICRWSVPFFLLITLISNMLILKYSYVYFITFYIQIVFYAVALLGYMNINTHDIEKYNYFKRLICKLNNNRYVVLIERYLKIPFYFCLVNLAIFIAWYKVCKKESFIYWKPSHR
jgi:glycosyltransferase involved in cell wall biosynthesis